MYATKINDKNDGFSILLNNRQNIKVCGGMVLSRSIIGRGIKLHWKT